MADFVAVIRRAVDGLATNTPETRAKVYDKARGAVQRQLENMKPRPPEEMLRRQMDKLESAIVSVEAEHSEALAAEPEAVPAEPSAAVAYSAPPVVEQVEPEASTAPDAPAIAAEPNEPEAYGAEAAPHAAASDAASPYLDDAYEDAQREPLEAEAPYEAEQQEAAAAAEGGAHDYEPEPEAAAPVSSAAPTPSSAEFADEPQAERYGDWRDDVPEELHDAPGRIQDQPHEDLASVRDAAAEAPAGQDDDASQHEALYPPALSAEREPPAEETHAPFLPWPEDGHGAAPEPQASEPVAAEQWTWSEPEPASQQAKAASAWDDIDDLIRPLDSSRSGGPVDAHFDREIHASAEPVRMPPVSDLPVPGPSPVSGEERAFADQARAQAPSAPAASPDERDPWSDLEDLIGYNRDEPAETAPAKPSAAVADEDFDDLLAPPSKPYRVTPTRKRNYTGMILGLVGLLLLGAGAYAVWINRDSLNELVSGLMQTAPAVEGTAQQDSAPAATSGAPASQPSTPQGAPAQTASPAAPAAQTPPAADGASSATKFTQRLMQDGSEVNEGPGSAGALAQNAEGQSVAQLNAPPADPGPAAPPATGAGAAPPAPQAGAAPTAPAAPTTTPADAPALSGEKMFLYEERIGQTAPTAIEGSVSWSLQREPAQSGGPPDPVVQGRITVPGRGLTALMTVKRNADSSLPASHLIEIVFAVPPDFEGGAIDSVLRIAMKQTEQDRGNALVAVPAKITDDFHMIALNDFPDARATNLDLLRTRNWIDIPVAYRNGRRALLTLQKGPEGQKAFEEAIREWSQAPNPQGTGQ